MRRLIIPFLVLGLLVVGAWLCRLDLLAVELSDRVYQPTWVRTVDGWERVGVWGADVRPAPTLHPLVVAAGQVLGSLLALAVFAPRRSSK